MKLFITLILLLILFSCLNAKAQLNFNPFYAKDGYQIAVNKAVELGYSNPKLIIVGTTTGEYQVSSFKINLEFNLDSGKATLWAFIFRSTNKPDSIKGIAIISSPFPKGDRYLAVEITPEQLKSFPIPGEVPVSTDAWINSDEIMNRLNNDINFNSFKSSCAEMRVKTLGLGMNPDFKPPYNQIPLWSGLFGNESIERNFYVDAITGDIVDSNVLDIEIERTNSRDVMAFPNPASDYIIMKTNFDNNEDLIFKLYDNTGNLVMEDKYSSTIDQKAILLPTNTLSSGTYSYYLLNCNNFVYGYFTIIK